ncbi:MAG TPA: Holliday junction branch migration protein RuvA [Acidimicrobiales bacterium]|nr:Holliday junction branch migration protein RuvA [Acidimicrobiales bacterium]
MRGTLLERLGDGEVLVEVNGVGYRLTVPASALAQVGATGDAVFLHVHTHVREDAIVLFGFTSRAARQCFEVLLTAHGVGPALALAILDVHDPENLRRVVETDDLTALTLVPGVGRKTAARLLIDLKSRLDGDGVVPVLDVPAAAGGRAGDTRAEVAAALGALGYGNDEVRSVLRDVAADGAVDDALRAALRALARGERVLT